MKIILTVVALTIASFSAQAASFDCSKASSKVEKLICSDALVSELDSSLNKVYSAIEEKPVEDQRAWIKNVRNKQTSVEGLAYVYASRIEELVNNGKYAYAVVDKAPKEPMKEVKETKPKPKSVVDNLKEHVAKGYIEADGYRVSLEVLEKFGDAYLDRCNVKMAYDQFKQIESEVYRTAPMKDVAWLDANKEAVVIGLANMNTVFVETPEDEASFRDACKVLFKKEEARLEKEKENRRLTEEFFENAKKK
ncbi:LprI domain-containing protein [Klebsiella phage vB_KpnM-VAC36]|nr:LprI domain-containing protein [Klebsiella phage vB_KpnM-VAC36]